MEKTLTPPDGWILVPPGDAALTQRIKAAGDHFAVAENKGLKLFSRGVWASAETIERVRAELEGERSTESFAKRKLTDAKRREKAYDRYVENFTVRQGSDGGGRHRSGVEEFWPLLGLQRCRRQQDDRIVRIQGIGFSTS
jgi:hypothetical protein